MVAVSLPSLLLTFSSRRNLVPFASRVPFHSPSRLDAVCAGLELAAWTNMVGFGCASPRAIPIPKQKTIRAILRSIAPRFLVAGQLRRRCPALRIWIHRYRDERLPKGPRFSSESLDVTFQQVVPTKSI